MLIHTNCKLGVLVFCRKLGTSAIQKSSFEILGGRLQYLSLGYFIWQAF